MELQALRYAAMVSVLTFDEAVDTFDQYLATNGHDDDARGRLLSFLDWEESDIEQFPKDVRLILAAAEFSKEITTTVLWLNDHCLDVKCVRLRPYDDAGRLLIDVQQVIPLPEAEDYQVRIRDKKVIERTARTQDWDLTRYDVTVAGEAFKDLPKRKAIYRIIRALCDQGVDPEEIRKVISWKSNALYRLDGDLDAEGFEKALATIMSEQGNKPDTHRYFIGNDQLIRASGKTYAVTKM